MSILHLFELNKNIMNQREKASLVESTIVIIGFVITATIFLIMDHYYIHSGMADTFTTYTTKAELRTDIYTNIVSKQGPMTPINSALYAGFRFKKRFKYEPGDKRYIKLFCVTCLPVTYQ